MVCGWSCHHRAGEQPDSQVGEGEGGVRGGALRGSGGAHSLPHPHKTISTQQEFPLPRQDYTGILQLHYILLSSFIIWFRLGSWRPSHPTPQLVTTLWTSLVTMAMESALTMPGKPSQQLNIL